MILSGFAAAQDIEASVSNTEVAMGDTLQYSIRVFQRQVSPPDLSPLTENGDFEILSSSTSSQFRNFNNQVESWVDFEIELFPQREGELEIPPIEVGGEFTETITITVLNRGATSNQPGNELFLETEVNKESVYVQEQLLFTIRLHYTINGIRNPQFTPLEMADTVIEMIGSPNQYERLVEGVRYGVYEMRYVIFPQRSGSLEIPDIMFRGEVTDGSSNFVFRNPNTRRVTAFIEGTTVDVMERPEASRNVNYWLPASDVSIEESWSSDITDMRVGDTIERTLTLRAEGLDGAMLPAFSNDSVEDANLYAEPPAISRTFVEGQIVGTRVETSSIVPTAPGFITVPAVNVTWWDTDTSQLKSASIPETRLTVATVEGRLPAEQSVADTGIDQPSSAPALGQDQIDSQNEATLIAIPRFWITLLVTLLLLGTAIAAYGMLVRHSGFSLRALLGRKIAAVKLHFSPQRHEPAAFAALKRACSQYDLPAIHDALIVWSRHHLEHDLVFTMDDLLRQHDHPELREACVQLQSKLYGSQGVSSFDAKRLSAIVGALRGEHRDQRRKNRRDVDYRLPPLYKV